MSIESVISVRNLKTGFNGTIIHEKLNLEVEKGEVLGVIGGSGAGKSVLLRTIIGLNKPLGGKIAILGREITRLSDKKRKDINVNIGVLFQDGALFSSLTVLENIQVPIRENLKLSKKLTEELAYLKISMVGLKPDAARKYPAELSGGMRKRAGLARALALDPKILFLDEPTAGLDPIGAAAFDVLILELRNTFGLTVFMVTHDLDSLNAICDRIAVLAEKKIIAHDSIQNVRELDHPWVREYFRGARGRQVFESGNS